MQETKYCDVFYQKKNHLKHCMVCVPVEDNDATAISDSCSECKTKSVSLKTCTRCKILWRILSEEGLGEAYCRPTEEP